MYNLLSLKEAQFGFRKMLAWRAKEALDVVHYDIHRPINQPRRLVQDITYFLLKVFLGICGYTF